MTRGRERPRRSRPKAALLRCAGLTKRYGDAPALGPVDLEIGAGEIVVLTGHNGSGKSTLLRLAAGLVEPSDGTVEIRGEPAGSARARATVSYLPDSPVLYDDLSLAEHLEYLSRLHGTTPEDQRVDDLVHSLGLGGRVDDLPSDFSRGLRQKAALTIGTCRPFSLLLLDEPFSGLDARGRAALVELLGRIRAERGTAVAATHDAAFVEQADRVLVLDDGRLVSDSRSA